MRTVAEHRPGAGRPEAPSRPPGSTEPARPVAVPALPLPSPDLSLQTRNTGRDRLSGPPWSQASFWVLQLVVLALYLVRLAVIVGFHLDTTSIAIEFSTLAIFTVPTVFAALRYGFGGAVVTSAWVSILAIPRFLAYAAAHQYIAAWAELLQIVLLNALALLIGQAVSAERTARRMAETAREAHLSAEALYRDLFDSNKAPILFVDAGGNVVEANAAALRAFTSANRRPKPPGSGPVRLVDMIGPDAAAVVLTRLVSVPKPEESGTTGGVSDRVEPVPFEVDGQPVLYRPTVTRLGRADNDRRIQVVFEDVTTETRRHDLMEAYAARVVQGQEEERRHIAQELHDGPVQSLVHLCRQIDLIGSPSDGGESTGPSLSDLRGLAEGAVAELRAIAKGLRPSILDDLGLVASIQQMLSESGGRRGFEASFGVTGAERRMPPAVELALFRIAQEALSNVERHAAATRVAIGIDFESGALRMLIKDDGVGFDTERSAAERGSQSLGLPGMVERANLIGARLAVHSAPGAGTAVDVLVPATIIE